MAVVVVILAVDAPIGRRFAFRQSIWLGTRPMDACQPPKQPRHPPHPCHHVFARHQLPPDVDWTCFGYSGTRTRGSTLFHPVWLNPPNYSFGSTQYVIYIYIYIYIYIMCVCVCAVELSKRKENSSVFPDHPCCWIEIKFCMSRELVKIVPSFKFCENQSRFRWYGGGAKVAFPDYFGWSLVSK